MALTAAHHKKAIVVVNGRIESYWKYQELFYDLFQQGYDIYALDHRGQGVSGRLAADTELGHVEQFSDYVTDLTTFYTEVVAPKNYRHRHLLAHSMGGTIASLFLAAFPDTLTSAVLSAPMHGIAIKNWMRPIASPLARVVEQFQRQPGYAPGQMPYYPKPFADNPLSHSAVATNGSAISTTITLNCALAVRVPLGLARTGRSQPLRVTGRGYHHPCADPASRSGHHCG
ncbi:lysophospholipase L2 [Photobacterium aphoticum]|uniref:Lysophospholipase L2 n=1 Tax=Photobacterium aphoticum TaxID=754436 RepID=A0A090QUX7_9GAMM|nr:lysophospholipase L2 [Photobacterium aphoticum]